MELWVLRLGPVPFYNSQLCCCFEWVFCIGSVIIHLSRLWNWGEVSPSQWIYSRSLLSLILHRPTKIQTTDLLLLLTFNQLFFQCFLWPIYETEGSYILHYRIYIIISTLCRRVCLHPNAASSVQKCPLKMHCFQLKAVITWHEILTSNNKTKPSGKVY